eukprot:scaffold43728_cov26-Prasinocladus_malaysianus.AAC.1
MANFCIFSARRVSDIIALPTIKGVVTTIHHVSRRLITMMFHVSIVVAIATRHEPSLMKRWSFYPVAPVYGCETGWAAWRSLGCVLLRRWAAYVRESRSRTSTQAPLAHHQGADVRALVR